MVNAIRLTTLLSPLSEDLFFTQYWDKQPLHVAREMPAFYESMLSAADVDFVIASACESARPAVEVLCGAESNRPPQSRLVRDAMRAHAEFRSGGTVRVQEVQRYWKPLAHLCRVLEDRFGFPVGANLYCTPSNSRGLQRHFDYYDVLVLQVAGQKRWHVYSSSGRLPVPWCAGRLVDGSTDGPIDVLGASGAGPDKEDTLVEVTLRAGDLLYVPRGFPHEVWTDGEHSAHVTIALAKTTWLHLAATALAQAADSNPMWREALPVDGWPGEEPSSEMDARWRALIESLSGSDLSGARTRLLDTLSRSRLDRGDGALLDATDTEAITLESEVELRPGLVTVLLEQEGDAVLVTGMAKVYASHTEVPALHFIREVRQFRVADLPGLDAPGKLALVRRLLRNGFLRLQSRV